VGATGFLISCSPSLSDDSCFFFFAACGPPFLPGLPPFFGAGFSSESSESLSALAIAAL